MKHKLETAPEEPPFEDKCCHYWIIKSPEGRTSKGRCKFCGVEKEFYNSWPYFMVGERAVKPPEFTDLPNSEPGEERGK